MIFDSRDARPGRAQNDLGVLYRVLERYSESEQLHRKALAALRASGAAELPIVINNLAQVLAYQGQWKPARKPLMEAIDLWERRFSPNDSRLAMGVRNLAALLMSRGKHADAERLLQRALAIHRRASPVNPRNVAVTLNNLRTLAAARKHYMEATALFRESLSIFQDSVPVTHPEVAEVTANLADMLTREGRLEESAEMYRQSREVLAQAWGPESPRLLQWLDPYVGVLRAREEFGEAERVRLQATRIRVTQVRAEFAPAAARRRD